MRFEAGSGLTGNALLPRPRDESGNRITPAPLVASQNVSSDASRRSLIDANAITGSSSKFWKWEPSNRLMPLAVRIHSSPRESSTMRWTRLSLRPSAIVNGRTGSSRASSRTGSRTLTVAQNSVRNLRPASFMGGRHSTLRSLQGAMKLAARRLRCLKLVAEDDEYLRPRRRVGHADEGREVDVHLRQRAQLKAGANPELFLERPATAAGLQ